MQPTFCRSKTDEKSIPRPPGWTATVKSSGSHTGSSVMFSPKGSWNRGTGNLQVPVKRTWAYGEMLRREAAGILLRVALSSSAHPSARKAEGGRQLWVCTSRGHPAPGATSLRHGCPAMAGSSLVTAHAPYSVHNQSQEGQPRLSPSEDGGYGEELVPTHQVESPNAP